jgi:hypothetical protein
VGPAGKGDEGLATNMEDAPHRAEQPAMGHLFEQLNA